METPEPLTTEDLFKAVREYADAHYETGGWDYIVESYSDEEILELIKGAKTKLGALRKVSAEIGVRAAVRRDVQSS